MEFQMKQLPTSVPVRSKELVKENDKAGVKFQNQACSKNDQVVKINIHEFQLNQPNKDFATLANMLNQRNDTFTNQFLTISNQLPKPTGESIDQATYNDRQINWYQIKPDESIVLLHQVDEQTTSLSLLKIDTRKKYNYEQRRLLKKKKADMLLRRNKSSKHKGVKCPQCGELFATKFTLERHRKSMHVNNKGVTCCYCNKKLRRKDYLSRHQSFHCKHYVRTDNPNRRTSLRKLRKLLTQVNFM